MSRGAAVNFVSVSVFSDLSACSSRLCWSTNRAVGGYCLKEGYLASCLAVHHRLRDHDHYSCTAPSVYQYSCKSIGRVHCAVRSCIGTLRVPTSSRYLHAPPPPPPPHTTATYKLPPPTLVALATAYHTPLPCFASSVSSSSPATTGGW